MAVGHPGLFFSPSNENVQLHIYSVKYEALDSKAPTELSLEHIEVIFEGIDDELNAKQRYISDVSPYLDDNSGDDDELLAEFTMEERLKFKIAKTFILQLDDPNDESGLRLFEQLENDQNNL